jgi:hypothetical protein
MRRYWEQAGLSWEAEMRRLIHLVGAAIALSAIAVAALLVLSGSAAKPLQDRVPEAPRAVKADRLRVTPLFPPEPLRPFHAIEEAAVIPIPHPAATTQPLAAPLPESATTAVSPRRRGSSAYANDICRGKGRVWSTRRGGWKTWRCVR